MSLLAPLRSIQDLDLAADAARHRSEKFAERKSGQPLEAARGKLDAELAAARAERTGLQAEEEQVAVEVAGVARDIDAAELERYSGKRMDRDEAAAHDESQSKLREKQAALEEREMELLEEIERVENRMEELESARATNLAKSEELQGAIHKVEAEVAAEIERLTEERTAIASGLPANVLTAYARVRAQSGKGGRGTAMLVEGVCHGCHTKLPSLEKTRMLAEPPEALIQCPRCRRVLIR